MLLYILSAMDGHISGDAVHAFLACGTEKDDPSLTGKRQ